jgi:glycine/D-amino acid oxidase-like deaminating enzyme
VKIAVVGSGVSGMLAARLLAGVHEVTLFEDVEVPPSHVEAVAELACHLHEASNAARAARAPSLSPDLAAAGPVRLLRAEIGTPARIDDRLVELQAHPRVRIETTPAMSETTARRFDGGNADRGRGPKLPGAWPSPNPPAGGGPPN